MSLLDTLNLALDDLYSANATYEGEFSTTPFTETISQLRTAIAELEAAEPVAWRYKVIPPYWTYSDKKPNKEFEGEYWDKWEVTSLYSHPSPAVPDGWLRAVDEAMVSSHLGIASASDSYEDAKKKLNDLICWNIDVATDPAVNGGFVLVPIKPTEEMLDVLYDNGLDERVAVLHAIYKAMLAAAPKGTP